MKVVYNGGSSYPHLTPGKTYEVIGEPHNYFFVKYIIDDRGKATNYSSDYFTPVYKIRQDKINEILK